MQTIKSTTKLSHPLMDEIETLYADLSDKAEHKKLVPMIYDKSLKGIVDIFSEQANITRSFKFINEDIRPLELPEFNKKNIIVCFSGGKDSFAVARHYQRLKYNVYL